METNINPEELITLVQERSVLWDKNQDQFKNKTEKINAWRQICCILIPNFETLDEKERQKCGKLLLAKWINLRDAWLRANKNEVKKSGEGAKFSKPYIYKEQMSFLKKIAEPNLTHDSVRKGPGASAAKAMDKSSEAPNTSKKENAMNLDIKMSKFLDSKLETGKKEEHPMLSFFKGVMPNVFSFDAQETLEFQTGVLTLIQKIKKQRECRLRSDYSWHSQTRDHMQQSIYWSQYQNMYPPENQNIGPIDSYGCSTRQPAETAALSQNSEVPSTSKKQKTMNHVINLSQIDNSDDLSGTFGDSVLDFHMF